MKRHKWSYYLWTWVVMAAFVHLMVVKSIHHHHHFQMVNGERECLVENTGEDNCPICHFVIVSHINPDKPLELSVPQEYNILVSFFRCALYQAGAIHFSSRAPPVLD